MAEEHTFDELKNMTVAQLREIAAEVDHPAVSGYTQKRKDEVLAGLCEAFGIEMHVHHEVVGINKRKIKDKIKALKVQRDAALEAHDSAELKKVRRQIHHLKRRIHKATV